MRLRNVLQLVGTESVLDELAVFFFRANDDRSGIDFDHLRLRFRGLRYKRDRRISASTYLLLHRKNHAESHGAAQHPVEGFLRVFQRHGFDHRADAALHAKT